MAAINPNPERFAKFSDLYRAALQKAVIDHPDQYGFQDPEKVLRVANKMLEAVCAGTYNKDGYAFKSVCKTLGIPHTYKAITAFLVG